MSGFVDVTKKPLVITIVIIVVVLYLISTLIYTFQNTNSYRWPPFGMTCPDYWTSRKTNNGYICTMDPNNANKGTKTYENSTITYYPNSATPTSIFSRGRPSANLSDKKTWARETGVAWDGA